MKSIIIILFSSFFFRAYLINISSVIIFTNDYTTFKFNNAKVLLNRNLFSFTKENNQQTPIPYIEITPINIRPIVPSLKQAISSLKENDPIRKKLNNLQSRIDDISILSCPFLMRTYFDNTNKEKSEYFFFCFNKKENEVKLKFIKDLTDEYQEFVNNSDKYLDFNLKYKHIDKPIIFTEKAKKGEHYLAYLNIESEGTVLKQNENAMQTAFSFRYDQVINCIGKTVKKTLDFTDSQCCYALDIEWNKKGVASHICSVKKDITKCKVEIKLIRSAIYRQCLKNHVDTLYNILIIHKGEEQFYPKDSLGLKRIFSTSKQIENWNLENSIKDDDDLKRKIIELKNLIENSKNIKANQIDEDIIKNDEEMMDDNNNNTNNNNTYNELNEDDNKKNSTENNTTEPESEEDVKKEVDITEENKTKKKRRRRRKKQKQLEHNDEEKEDEEEGKEEEKSENSTKKNITIIKFFPKNNYGHLRNKVNLLQEVNDNIKSFSQGSSKVPNLGNCNFLKEDETIIKYPNFPFAQYFNQINQIGR